MDRCSLFAHPSSEKKGRSSFKKETSRAASGHFSFYGNPLYIQPGSPAEWDPKTREPWEWEPLAKPVALREDPGKGDEPKGHGFFSFDQNAFDLS